MPVGSSSSLPHLRRDNATAWVCLAMHLEDSFADSVHDELCRPTSRALAPSPGLDLKVVAHNAMWLRQQRHRQALVLTTATAGMTAGTLWLVLGLASSRGLPVLAAGIIVLSAIGAIGWSVTVAAGHAWRVADLIVSDQLWDPGPGLLTPAQEDRLDKINGSNLCIYSDQLRDPFPGLGERLTQDVIGPVSITRPKDRSKPVIPFAQGELHAHLGRELFRPRPDGLNGWNTAYIDGTWVRNYRELYPDDSQVPAVRLPTNMVKDIADHPSEGARTYVTGYSIKHGGSLVCSMSARFTLQNGTLVWDVSSRMLFPVSLSFLHHDLGPFTRFARMRWAVLKAITSLPRELARAPRTVAGDWYATRRALWLLEPVGPLSTQEEVKLFGDVGATTSLRQRVSYPWLTFNQITDSQDGFQRLLYFFYTEIDAFLSQHNIVNEFRRQQSVTMTNILGNIHAQNVAVGPGAQNNTASSPGGGQGNAGAPGVSPQPGGP